MISSAQRCDLSAALGSFARRCAEGGLFGSKLDPGCLRDQGAFWAACSQPEGQVPRAQQGALKAKRRHPTTTCLEQYGSSKQCSPAPPGNGLHVLSLPLLMPPSRRQP